MNFSFLIILFSILPIKSEKRDKIYQVFSNVIEELFNKHQIEYDIVIITRKNSILQDTAKGFLKVTNNSLLNHLKIVNDLTSLEKSAIILVETFSALQKLNRDIKLKNLFTKSLKFLIYCHQLSIDRILEVSIQKLYFNSSHISQFEYFITETKKEIQVSTIEWFSVNTCNKAHLKILGSCQKKFKKCRRLKINKKFEDFHKCVLVDMKLNRDVDSYIDKLTKKPAGYLIDFVKICSIIGNFTPYFQFIDGSSLRSTKNELQPLNGRILIPHLKVLVKYQLSMFNGVYHVTSAVADYRMIFVTTPGEEFTSYEKMLLPFDTETWTYLATYFAMAFLIIFIINRMPVWVQNVIYGSNIHSAAFNVIGNFFGIPQNRIPRNNFARILLMFFVYFCLVIRTAYQGVLFNLMTNDIRKHLPETIDELYEKNFTICARNYADINDAFLTLIDRNRRPKILALPFKEWVDSFTKNIRNSSLKLAYFMIEEEFLVAYSNVGVNGIRLKQDLLTSFVGITSGRNHFLQDIFEKALQLSLPTGIYQHVYDFHQWVHHRQSTEIKVKYPTVLTVEDLAFGFNIWIMTCGLALLLMTIEVFVYSGIKIVKDLIGLIGLLSLGTSFFL